MLKQQVTDLKKYSVQGMKAIVYTIQNINENSQKILFKHFNPADVNVLAKEVPSLVLNIEGIAKKCQETVVPKDINDEAYESDSSGNQSENDEVNKI